MNQKQKNLLKFQRKHLTANKASIWVLITAIILLVLVSVSVLPSSINGLLPWIMYLFWYLQGRDDARRADAKIAHKLHNYRLGIEIANESWDAVKGVYKALGGKNMDAVQSIYDEYRFEMSKGPKDAIKAYNRTITRKRERLNEKIASRTDT